MAHDRTDFDTSRREFALQAIRDGRSLNVSEVQRLIGASYRLKVYRAAKRFGWTRIEPRPGGLGVRWPASEVVATYFPDLLEAA